MKLLIIISLFPFILRAQTGNLKVLTINVWSGLDYNGSLKMGEYESPARRNERFLILLSKLKELSPDVIFLQDANLVGEFAKKLVDSLSFDEIHQVCNAGIKEGSIGIPTNLMEGISILAKPNLMLDYYDTWVLM